VCCHCLNTVGSSLVPVSVNVPIIDLQVTVIAGSIVPNHVLHCDLFRTVRPLVVFQLKAASSLLGMCLWSSFVVLYDWDCCLLFIRSLEVCVTQHSYSVTTILREGVTFVICRVINCFVILLSHCHVSCVLCWDPLFAAVCKVLNFSSLLLACSAGSYWALFSTPWVTLYE